MEYKSRFKILKGGKIALVLSAMLIGSSSFSATQEVSTALTSQYTIADGDGLNITSSGSITEASIEAIINDDDVSSISNAGTITASSSEGIYIYSATVSGSITNTGTITADQDGIEIEDSITSGSITNTGIINANGNTNESGIEINKGTLGGSIINDGTITSTGDNGIAVWGDNSGDFLEGVVTGQILNTGIIDAQIEVLDIDDNAWIKSGIENSGAMISQSAVVIEVDEESKIENGILNTSTGSLTGLDGIEIDGNSEVSGGITNQGTITAQERGIFIEEDSSIDFIKNEKTIDVNSSANDTYGIKIDTTDFTEVNNTSTGVIKSNAGDDYDAYGLYFEGVENFAEIKNAGKLSAISNDGLAYALTTNDDTDSIITNTGTIEALSTNNYSYGIYINGDFNTGSQINNDGKIIATNSLSDLSSTNPQYLDKDSYSLYIDRTNGTVNNNINGKMYGNIYIGDYTSSTFNNYGLITLPSNANGADSAYISTYLNKSSGTLEISLQTNGTTTTNSQLSTVDATFESGSTVSVNILSASTNEELIIGNSLLDVVSASNSLIINGPLNVTDNSALLNFEYVEDGETIDLNIVEAATILDTTVAGLGNKDAQKAAKILDEVADNDFKTFINTLGTEKEVAKAIETFVPGDNVSTTAATTQIVNTMQNIVELRQRQVGGNSGINSGDELMMDKQMWVKPYVGKSIQGSKDGISGYDVNFYGLGIGYDNEIKNESRLGLGLFYTDAKVDVKDIEQNTDISNVTALVYGSTPIFDDKTEFLYQVGYSIQNNKSYKTISGFDMSSKYRSKAASIDLKLMRSYKLSSVLNTKPIIEASVRRFETPTYTETGSNTTILSNTNTQKQLSIGNILEYTTSTNSKLITDTRIGYNFDHDKSSVNYMIEGATEATSLSGIDNGGITYGLGLAYETTSLENIIFDIGYNLQGEGKEFQNHSLSAKFVYKF